MTLDAVPNGNAVYFDGRSNRKRHVELRFAAELEIVEEGAVTDTWPYGNVRRADGMLDALRLSCTTALPLARLETIDEETKAAIVSRCPSLDASRGAPQTGRIVFWSLAAVCSIVMLVLFVIPVIADRLAPFIPMAFEKRLGEGFDRQARTIFGGKLCNATAGQAAFTSLVDKLARAGDIDIPLNAQVVSSAVPNAFALPGGKVYLLNGLLQKAQNTDEIAGVLAHELGHVKHRDHMRKLIQTGGTSFLVGLLFGDVTGAGAVIFAGRSLLDASYSRDAEQSADAFAADVMHKLGRSSAPMGEFLLRVTGAQANKSYTIFASHPLTEERRAAMADDGRTNTGQELLSATEWTALKNICRP